MERTKRSAKAERAWAQKHWDNYEEEAIPPQDHRMFADLFSDKPQERTFGKGATNNPFAGLSDLLKVGDNH